MGNEQKTLTVSRGDLKTVSTTQFHFLAPDPFSLTPTLGHPCPAFGSFHVPGLSWAATSMIAAEVFFISYTNG